MDSPTRPKAASTQPSLPAPRTTTALSTPMSSASGTVAGSKRQAPSLLPAFEPLSSSPGLPRPLKRQNTGNHAHLKYPTPVPTSSTGILSSSPPRRPGLTRTLSERAPLASLPSVELSENGETLIMGRSSNSSHYQLSANRLVSRVHVKARYIPATKPLEGNKLEIICNGWNGLKLHCQGRTWELFKGDSFTSETEGTEIMVDVQDARVMIQWPKRGTPTEAIANLSDSSWDDSPRSQTRNNALLQSSPLRRTTRITSPESPTPAPNGHLSSSQRLQALFPSRLDSDEDQDQGIQIYEDEPEPELPGHPAHAVMDVGASMNTDATASFSSDLSDLEDNDPDEENDPIVHSFGPFGANIAGRMASITTKSPRAIIKPSRPLHQEALRKPLPGHNEQLASAKAEAEGDLANVEDAAPSPQSEKTESRTPPVDIDPSILNHVINQLAFSRLSSTPLSTIMQNLPTEARAGLTKEILRDVVEASSCVGIIARQGKDAAGKALESEYYYVPENDDDESRRAAVVDGLRKPSLRNCRKQHKQYYWKRPKTP